MARGLKAVARVAPRTVALALLVSVASCTDHASARLASVTDSSDLAAIAPGWRHELIAGTDQSYAGWDVELADLDGDQVAEILTGSAPDSRIYLHRRDGDGWHTRTLVDNLAAVQPGMVLGLEVVDLDRDGRLELLAGTGQETGMVAKLAVMQLDGAAISSFAVARGRDNTSSFTHGLATIDADGDGTDEVFSSYCPHGEVVRFDVDGLAIRSEKVLQLSGSGEDILVHDLDGDGAAELVVVNAYREGAGRVEIFDFDPTTGNPKRTPRLVLDELDGQKMFYASIATGDIDGDGAPELIVGWKPAQADNRASIVAYKIRGATAEIAYTLTRDDPRFDLSYFEKMISIADLDLDGRNEIVITTRGDGTSEGVASDELGHVFVYAIRPDGTVHEELVVDFAAGLASSSWVAVDDVDGDRRPDIVLATGHGDREERGASWVLRVWRE